MYVYVCVYIYIYIYTYAYRERENTYIYIYIYILHEGAPNRGPLKIPIEGRAFALPSRRHGRAPRRRGAEDPGIV